MQISQLITNELNSNYSDPSFFVDIHMRLRTLEHPSNLSKIGLWHEGVTSWIGDPYWIVNAAFSKTASTVISQAYHKLWNVKLTIHDAQTEDQLGFIRTITLKNESSISRPIKLLLHQVSLSTEEGVVFYSPFEKALIHHTQELFSLHSVSMPLAYHIQHGAGDMKRNWNDQEGKLFFSPFSATSVESVIACSCTLEPNRVYKAQAWQLIGKQLSVLKQANKKLMEQ